MPAGGDLKRIVMLPLTGECSVVMLDFELIGEENWQSEDGTWMRRVKTKARRLEKASNVCC